MRQRRKGVRIRLPGTSAMNALALRSNQNGLPRRWRFHCASVLIALAYEGRWRWEGAKMGYPDAGAGKGAKMGLPRRWRVHCAGVLLRWRVKDAGVSIALAY
jgi:hypothetical protein